MLSSAEGRAISMSTILTLLNSMKLSVYPPFPMFPFNLLFTVIVFALLLPNSVSVSTRYEACQNQTCGSTPLLYPFRKRGCGLQYFEVDCVDNLDPVLEIDSTNYTILSIAPAIPSVTLATEKSFQNCEPSSDGDAPSSGSLNSIFHIIGKTVTTVYKCLSVCTLSPLCPALTENVSIESWTVRWDISEDVKRCQVCEDNSGYCGYNSTDLVCFYSNGTESYLYSRGKTGKQGIGPIVGGSVGGVLGLALLFILCTYCRMRASSSTSKVEKFLHDYIHEMPTRYSYSQLKKITNNFAEKLGEGGFGVVYKGKLSEENLVAVKLLDQSRQSESQFMNEVATIGRIHHVHLVRLMGYCFEGFGTALVYEYMANGSLEKFLFAKKEKRQILSGEQLYSIALGAARGIAYLHQDCERRIIHFDIKPHNILLDADFTPKVADFGLAKLCGRLDDHISVTAARGTPGYVAPEVWSRNLGRITEKADVYSFGMLLLEIAGGRKNIDVEVGRSSELYFPDWAFKHLEKGELEERLRGPIVEEMEGQNDMQVMRMCKVGLWCIQYKSMERPTMSRVVQMLEGNGEEVRNPPFPFNGATSVEAPLMSSSWEESSSSVLHWAPVEEAPVLTVIPTD